MSEWFDLLNFGSPRGRCDATPRRHRSASPSPRGRVAWQPSSSPLDQKVDERLNAPKELPLSHVHEDEQENTPVQLSPSRMRTVRARRRARRAHAHAPYTYAMYAYSQSGPQDSGQRASPASGAPPSPSPRFTRVHSDPVTASHQPHDTQDKPGSDDSFTRLIGDDELDAAAVEELALRQGW